MYSPYQTMPVGECRVPCGPSGECEARGGVPHVCLADGAGGCFPGRFGLPCTDSSQCMAGFTCETVTNQIAAGGPITQAVCTVPCTTDADCDANPWTTNAGYCDGGYCQLGAGTGEHCERNAHCRTRRCQLPPARRRHVPGQSAAVNRRAVASFAAAMLLASGAGAEPAASARHRVGGRRRVGSVGSHGGVHRLRRRHGCGARRQSVRSGDREARRAFVRREGRDTRAAPLGRKERERRVGPRLCQPRALHAPSGRGARRPQDHLGERARRRR